VLTQHSISKVSLAVDYDFEAEKRPSAARADLPQIDHGAIEEGAARHGPAQLGTARRSSARPGAARHGPAERGVSRPLLISNCCSFKDFIHCALQKGLESWRHWKQSLTRNSREGKLHGVWRSLGDSRDREVNGRNYFFVEIGGHALISLFRLMIRCTESTLVKLPKSNMFSYLEYGIWTGLDIFL